MALVRTCDKCGARIDTDGPLSDQSWVQARVALDDSVHDGGNTKDYHRSCARSITLAEVWAKPNMVPL